jgi:hypothetical protein
VGATRRLRGERADLVVTGMNDEAIAQARGDKQQIAFRDHTGISRCARAARLGRARRSANAMSKRASGWRWGSWITDEMLDTFAVVAHPTTSPP